VAFSPDGRLLAEAGENGQIKLHDLHQLQNGRTLGETNLTGKHATWDVAFSPNGKFLASGGEDGLIKIWDPGTGSLLKKVQGFSGGVECVAFVPARNLLAACSREDRAIRVWDVETGEPRSPFEHPGHMGGINRITFSPDGKFLASAGDVQTVILWEVETRTQLRRLKGHIRRVTGLAFSPDSKRLASSSLDMTVRVWDPVTGQETMALRGDTRFTGGLVFSPDNRQLVASSVNGVKIWKAPIQDE
jgi:WD40 repeat protein